MMQRNFSAREKVLLCILVVLLLTACYLQMVVVPVTNTKAAAAERLADAETAMTVEQFKAGRLKAMEEKLAQVSTAHLSELAPYDNVRAVAELLNTTLSVTDSYELKFRPVKFQGDIAVRTIDMTFTCGGYDTVRGIVDALYASPYRCEITDVTVLYAGRDNRAVAEEDRSIFDYSVDGRISIIFYESYRAE